MAQTQKQKINLTDLLKDTIKNLRKTHNKRGDVLSKELDRGASYISQLENGKIRDIEFDLLNNMFQLIIGLTDNYYNDYMQKYIYEIISNAPTKEYLFNENWIHIFVMQNFQTVIPDSIIEVIKKKLEQINYMPEQLVERINQNIFQHQWLDIKRETNKLYVDISSSYDNYSIYTDITYSLPDNYVSLILSKETTAISYIFMYGILQNLYALESNNLSGAIDKAEKILFDNGFFNTIEIYENLHKLSHSQQPLNIEATVEQDTFTFYDEVIVNYNEKYIQLKEKAFEKLNYAFDRYKKEHISYACETIEKIIENMDGDLGLIMAILSSPLSMLPNDMTHFFWDDFKLLIEHYTKYKQ